MDAKQALAWVKKCGIAVESARATVPSLPQVVAGEPLRGSWWAHPKGNDIFRLSRAIRRSPDVLVCLAGGWENYLRPSADVARPRFIRRTIFQAETCSLERSAHACGQAQVTGHSISRLGADRSPASRTEADRERGCFTIGGRPVTFELNMNMPPNKCAPANRRYGFSARSGIRSNYSASKMPNNSAHF